MPISSFRVTFPEDDCSFRLFYAKNTFIKALEHIGWIKLKD